MQHTSTGKSTYIPNYSIIEGFIINSKNGQNIITFDPKSKDFINTSFGKFATMKPYQCKLAQNQVCYTVYQKAKEVDQVQYNDVLKAIKQQNNSSNFVIDQNSLLQFMTRTAIYIADKLSKQNVDTIFIMDSSSSFIYDLVFQINKRLPKYYNIHTFNKVVFKTQNFDNITISPEAYDKFGEQHLKSAQSTIEKIKRDGIFQIKKFDVKMRKFVKNWLELNQSMLSNIVDKDIILFDDFFTTGATMNEAVDMLMNAGANSVTGWCVMKG